MYMVHVARTQNNVGPIDSQHEKNPPSSSPFISRNNKKQRK